MGGPEGSLKSEDLKAATMGQKYWMVNKLQFFELPVEGGLEMIKGFKLQMNTSPQCPRGHTTQLGEQTSDPFTSTQPTTPQSITTSRPFPLNTFCFALGALRKLEECCEIFDPSSTHLLLAILHHGC
jgi:hypothetical protein